MNSPLVSIVIPTYNRAQDLIRALKSVLDQQYQNWEVIIVDNNSQDNTQEIVENFNEKRFKFYLINNDGVIAKSRNLGIFHAAGEYVAFLDSDDWWSRYKLTKSIKYLEKGFDVVYHNLEVKRDKPNLANLLPRVNYTLQNPVYKNLIIHGNQLENSSVVVRKSILDTIGSISIDPSLKAIEDFDTWLKIASVTDKFYKLKGVHGFYWFGGDNTSGPSTNLNVLKAFQRKYQNDFDTYCSGNLPWWFLYNRARSNYVLGEIKESKNDLEKIIKQNVPFIILLKVVYMLMICQFK